MSPDSSSCAGSCACFAGGPEVVPAALRPALSGRAGPQVDITRVAGDGRRGHGRCSSAVRVPEEAGFEEFARLFDSVHSGINLTAGHFNGLRYVD